MHAPQIILIVMDCSLLACFMGLSMKDAKEDTAGRGVIFLTWVFFSIQAVLLWWGGFWSQP